MTAEEDTSCDLEVVFSGSPADEVHTLALLADEDISNRISSIGKSETK